MNSISPEREDLFTVVHDLFVTDTARSFQRPEVR
jgi:hypothetical protein